MQSLRRIHATCLRVYARIYTDRGTVYCLALVVQFLLKSCFFSSYLCKVSYFTPGGLCRFASQRAHELRTFRLIYIGVARAKTARQGGMR